VRALIQFHRWLGAFRRITTSGNYIPEIDGLRLIAIGVVVIYHLGMWVQLLNGRHVGLFELGARGVELFFTISGFVLAAPFVSQYLRGGARVRLGAYFLRRITRLEPPYLIALLLTFVMWLLISDLTPARLAPHLLASSLYVHTIVFGTTSTIMLVAWSLEIEVQFYILMPLIALIFLIRNPWLRRGILLAAMVGVTLCQPINLPAIGRYFLDRDLLLENPVWYQHIGNYIQFFLAGILLADIYVVNWNSNPARNAKWGDLVWLTGWPLLVGAVLVIQQAASHSWPELADRLSVINPRVARLAFPLLIFGLYAAAFRSTIVRRLISLPLIATIGGMCYSIYLVHLQIIQVVGLALEGIFRRMHLVSQMLVEFALLTPVIVIICAIFYRLIERPCMRRDWPRRLWGMFLVDAAPADRKMS